MVTDDDEDEDDDVDADDDDDDDDDGFLLFFQLHKSADIFQCASRSL